MTTKVFFIVSHPIERALRVKEGVISTFTLDDGLVYVDASDGYKYGVPSDCIFLSYEKAFEVLSSMMLDK